MKTISPAHPIYRALPGALLFSLAHAVMAHPGHDLRGAEISHLLTSPYHLLVLGLGGFALVSAGWIFKRRKVARKLRRAGTVLLLATAACALSATGW